MLRPFMAIKQRLSFDPKSFLAKMASLLNRYRLLLDFAKETLAEMIGTTRARVSFFMNKFRQLGFIGYNGGIAVHGSLLNVVLHDQPQIKI